MRVTLRPPADRERDRAPPPPLPYTSGTNFLRLPGMPEDERDRVPRPDGRLGERSGENYGPEWVRAERVRDIRLQTDALFQFARLVAGNTGHALDTYWRGGASPQNMTDMLIANVISDPTQFPAPGTTLDNESRADHERALREAFRLADEHDTSAVASAFRAGTLGGGAGGGGLRLTPEQQQTWERLFRTADEQAATTTPSASARSAKQPTAAAPALSLASASSAPRTPIRPPAGAAQPTAVPPPPPAPVPGPDTMPLDRPLRAGPAPSRTPLEPDAPHRRVVTAEEMAAREQSVTGAAATSPALTSADDGRGHLVAGVNNQHIMLLRLLLRGATQWDLQAWRLLYNVPDKSPDTVEGRARLLKDIATMRALLRRGEGGVDWVRAPQHTGYIFFSDSFGAAVTAAMADIHGICGHPEVCELDLMTHERVRVYFARLVANQLNAARTRGVSRWGGSATLLREHKDERARLIQLFRRLVVASDGYLAIEGLLVEGADQARRATAAARAAYTAQTGRYYSDIPLDVYRQ